MPKIEFQSGPAQLPSVLTDHYQQILAENGHHFKVARLGVFEVTGTTNSEDVSQIWHPQVITQHPEEASLTLEDGQLKYRKNSTSMPETLQPQGLRLVREVTNMHVRRIRGGVAVVFTENEILSKLHRSFELQPGENWNTYGRIAVPGEFLSQDLAIVLLDTPNVYSARNPYLRTDRIIYNDNGELVPNAIVHVRHRM